MRLNRLDLIRYGRFKDAEITFPKRDEGVSDVTVIFGPNEAGKSTAYHAFLELLFGFKGGAHPYAFRFDRSDLLVGAELDLPGRGVMALRRNSKRSQSLLDANDRPINEAILSGALYGLTRDTYEERFSLNEKGLREGGERIAGAQGDLGQLLHAGLSGLTGMAQTLDALAERADKFHKKRGRGNALKTGSDRLKEIGRELRADRLTTERERNLRHDRDRAAAEFEGVDAELRQAHQRQAASKAAEVWYDLTEEKGQLTEALVDFPDGPELPPGAAERVAGLVEKIAAQTIRITEAEEEITKQDRIIADNPVDMLAQLLTAELERLDQLTIDGAPLMGRASTARADLARRSEDQEKLSSQIDTVLRLLQVPDAPASTIALEASVLEHLAAAVQECLTASISADAARKAVEAARVQQGDAPAEPQDLTALRAAFDLWKTVADLTALETDQSQALARLTKVTAGLPGSWKELISEGLPTRETLDEVGRNWAALAADLASASNDLDARAAELAEARGDLSAHEAAPDAVDIVITEETRRRRDMVWQQHRGDLTTKTADQFEAAMYADDGTRAHYLTGAEARQRLLAAQSQERTADARHGTAKTRHDDLVTLRDRLSERCSRLALALGLEEDAAPSAFSARQQTLNAAAEAAADHSNAKEALRARLAHQEAARDALIGAARPLGLDPAKGALPTQVQRALTLEDSDRKAWAKWQDGEKTIAKLDSKSEECRTDCETAQGKLDRLTAALPLPDHSLEAIRAALPHLRSLQQLYGEHQKLSARIEALEKAVAALADGAQSLNRILDDPEEEPDIDPVRVIDRARVRVAASMRADEKRAEATSRRDETASLKSRAKTEFQAAIGDLDGCFNGQGGQDLAPRDRVAKLVERDRLRADKATADRDRQKARDSVDADLFAEELNRMPDATRAAELEQALKDAQDSRDTARDAQREAARLYREAFEAADRSDLATEQATLLEELRSGARQAAVARLGVLASRGALRRLAAERRSGMLRDVEEAFVTMTAPKWKGVDVWSQAEGEKLVGIQPNGSTVPVEQMSTGTMGQLYFALRLAGYRSFAREPGPLPMILDDIMETFDDTRARAALRLCAEIGTNGQAILFTHHAHLVELARDTIKGVTVVNMPD
ncbi:MULTISPECIES: AAA family ATPase [Roseobacteraceae]|jgi:chromosome segregation protein|uniref:AAA domain protein n=1 Tax=Pseudosulfitobacter pseudonitzschiae TaxID=1402135 RepID=A0A221K8C0_9RHOB|nr:MULTISPECIES: AAA family ATPase [Roseobacteraceae]ASM75261.1 AAA domain protein [Pseudosulfitobacter pseudonitzschiae]MBW4963696.1 AAA family ATPase [Sulfitobacter sp. CW3]|tara:strand:- start:3643 stop:7050 length:3408 start_codon:yes stop_codon:yes gene_type:complete